MRENANYSRAPALNQHPSQPIPKFDATVTASEFWIRLEHQLLLKLLASRSILFAIHVEVVALSQVLASPEVAGRLARWLETMPNDAADYKSVLEARKVIVPLLRDAQTREQRRSTIFNLFTSRTPPAYICSLTCVHLSSIGATR